MTMMSDSADALAGLRIEQRTSKRPAWGHYRNRYASQAKQGDVIELDDERRFQIVSVRPDGMSRVVWGLVELR